MESFRIALSVVSPLVVYMLIGILLRRMNVSDVGRIKSTAVNADLFHSVPPL